MKVMSAFASTTLRQLISIETKRKKKKKSVKAPLARALVFLKLLYWRISSEEISFIYPALTEHERGKKNNQDEILAFEQIERL